MKRLWAVAIVALLSLSAAAQIRGIPASVTSITPTRSVSGIPASVTSLGPNGYGGRYHVFNNGFNNYNSVCSSPGPLIPSAMGCTSPYFTRPLYNLPPGTQPTNLRPRGHGGGYYPIYVPYTVPIPVVVEPVPVEAVPEEGTMPPTSLASEEEVQPPAMTVYEHRPTTTVKPATPPIDESRVYHPGSQQAAAEQAAEPPAPPVVLIYKDGHQAEVQNYAIVGKYLYEVSGYTTRKIPLADLNLTATAQANDDRGIEFAVPSGTTP